MLSLILDLYAWITQGTFKNSICRWISSKALIELLPRSEANAVKNTLYGVRGMTLGDAIFVLNSNYFDEIMATVGNKYTYY